MKQLFTWLKIGLVSLGLAFIITIIILFLLDSGKKNFTQNNPSPEKIITGYSQDNQDQTNSSIKSNNPTAAGQSTEQPSNLIGVIKVIDGDTIEVERLGKIRLIGVDTPEVVDPRKPVQCFGREASKITKEMLLDKNVRLESDPTQGNRDKYDRLLRYVFLEDGTLFNQWLIENGYAHEYTYKIPYQYQQQFKEAEKSARENNRGFWSPDACNGDTTKSAS